MKRFAWSWLLLLLVPHAASSFEVGYEFGGLLEEHFAPILPVSELSLTQQNGALEFHTFDLVASEGMTGYVYQVVRPRVSQSWAASLDVAIPAIYESSAGNGMSVGLGVGHNYEPSTATGDFASIELLVDPTAAVRRVVQAEYSSSHAPVKRQTPVTSESVTVTLEYDALTRQLRAQYTTGPLSQVNTTISVLDWAFASGDRFEFFVFGTVVSDAIFESSPLTIDNFNVKVAVPESRTIGLMAWGVLPLGYLGYRRRRHWPSAQCHLL